MGESVDTGSNEQKAIARGEGSLAINAAQYANVTVYQYVTYAGDKVTVRETADPSRCPYPGLETFRTSDAKYFAGREADVTELEVKLRDQDICGVIAASGAGKSSLVHAGLIPVLAKRETEAWDVFAFKPGDNPLLELAKTLSGVLAADKEIDDQRKQAKSHAESLQLEPGVLAEYLQLIRQRREASAGGNHHHVLIFVDQWEELYTRENDADRDILVRELMDVAKRGLAKVLLTMRIDFMDELVSKSTEFYDVLEPAVRILRPLSETGRRAAIEKPAEVAGLGVPPELTSRLVADLGKDEGTLPYLQFVLRQLWEKRDTETNSLTTATYDSMDGLKGAIGAHADDVFRKLSKEEQGLAKRVLPRLANVSDNGITSRRMPFADFDEPALKLLRRLAEPDARLIVLSSATEDVSEAEIVAEVAHEALLDDWKTLSGWIADRKDFFRLRNKLEADAKTWVENERPRDLKISEGLLLESAVSLKKVAEKQELSENCIEYIEFSVKNTARARRRRTISRTLTAIILVASMLGFLFTYINREQIVAERFEQNREDLFRAASASWSHEEIAKFAIATWPRSSEDKDRIQTGRALDLLSGSIPFLFAIEKIVLPQPTEIKEIIPNKQRAVVLDQLNGIMLVDTKARRPLYYNEDERHYSIDYKLGSNGAVIMTWSAPFREYEDPVIQFRNTTTGEVIHELSGIQIVEALAVSEETASAIVLDHNTNPVLLDLELGKVKEKIICSSLENEQTQLTRSRDFARGAIYLSSDRKFILWTNSTVCEVDSLGNTKRLFSSERVHNVKNLSESDGFLLHHQSKNERFLVIHRIDGSIEKGVRYPAEFDSYAISDSQDRLVVWNDSGVFQVRDFNGTVLQTGEYQKDADRMAVRTDIRIVAVHAKFLGDKENRIAVWAEGNPFRLYSVEDDDEIQKIYPTGEHNIRGPLVSSDLSSVIFWDNSALSVHDVRTGIIRHLTTVTPLSNELHMDEAEGVIHQIVGSEFRTADISKYLRSIVIGNNGDHNADAVISPTGELIAYWTRDGVGTYYDKVGKTIGAFEVRPGTYPKFDSSGKYFLHTGNDGKAMVSFPVSDLRFEFDQVSGFDENEIVHTESGALYSTTSKKGDIEVYSLPGIPGESLEVVTVLPFEPYGPAESTPASKIRSSSTRINKSGTRLVRRMIITDRPFHGESVVVEVWDLEVAKRIYVREFLGVDVGRKIELDSTSNVSIIQIGKDRLIALDIDHGNELWNDTELIGSRPMIIPDHGVLLYKSESALESADLLSGSSKHFYTFSEEVNSQSSFEPPEQWLVSENADLLLAWNGHRASILKTDGLQKISTLRTPHGRLRGASFINDSRLITWGEDNRARVWDVLSGVQLDVYTTTGFGFPGAIASADGSTSLSWNKVNVWTIGSGQPEYTNGVAVIFDLSVGDNRSVFEIACSRLNDNVHVDGGPEFSPNLPLNWKMREICGDPSAIPFKLEFADD